MLGVVDHFCGKIWAMRKGDTRGFIIANESIEKDTYQKVLDDFFIRGINPIQEVQ
jgi:hypothetical protein